MYVVNGSDGLCLVAVRLIVGVRYLERPLTALSKSSDPCGKSPAAVQEPLSPRLATGYSPAAAVRTRTSTGVILLVLVV